MKPCWLFAGALVSLPLLAATPEPLYQLQWETATLPEQRAPVSASLVPGT